jgi:Tol biopolymer transport system component
VRAIVQGCLVKDRAKRTPDISAIRLLMNTGEQALAPSESQTQRAVSTGRWLATAGAGIAVGAALAAGVGLPLARRPTADPAPVRFAVPAPGNAAFGVAIGSPGMSLSPDGRHLAFVIPQRGSESGLWIRPLDALDARALPGTRGAAGVPFWSPDGRHVGFLADRKLKKIDVASGLTTTVCDTPALFGATWNQHGDILFSNGVELLRVPSAGGAPTVVTTPDRSKEEREHRWPQFLPDGAQFLYLNVATTNSTIVAASLNSPTGKPLRESDSKALYASPGFLVFSRQGSLFAQPFDAKRAAISGEAVAIAEGINAARGGASSFALSDSGVLAFRYLGIGMAELSWFDRAGKALGRFAEAAQYLQVSLSPDGKQIAAQRGQGASAEIWLIDSARGVSSRFKEGAGPVWSPDSVELAYYDLRSGLIQRTAHDGTRDKTFAPGLTGIVEDWSKDGRYLIYLDLAEGVDVWALALDDLKPLRITATAAAEDEPALSPDGRWLAYMSTESGRSEIYVRSFPPRPGDRTTRISTKGGHQPKWRGDGRELFFLTPEGVMMAVDISSTPAAMEPGTPLVLFQTGINVSAIVDQYGVTADGQKFLVITPSGDASESPIAVVLNWAAGLKR